MYLNIRYEEQILRCVTGISLKVFTMDKRIEQGWDAWMGQFLKEKGIAYIKE